ncbi:helix-turn-helix transcriptional regulator [Agilicoccus flavus]|uniref:helix-turn-helix transcriptional regulator n=1 Tax=Agilicoccus flavus TaxID=2775968 RepID=UPI0027D9E3A9|nr:AAA family ATPase [Agilicoccus flavus]
MTLAPRHHPLVGRDRELDAACRLLGLGPTAPSRVSGLVVGGDAGIGKSRFIAELAHRAGEAGRLVAAGHCVGAAGSGTAWLPFVELVGALVAAEPDASEEVLERHPALASLVAGRDVDAPAGVSPGAVGEAVQALLVAVGRRRPLLAVVEDVHWSDRSSRELLTLLLTRGFDGDVTLVVSYRSDDLHRQHPLYDTLPQWTRLPLVGRISLGPLPAGAIRELVAGQPGPPLDPATVDRVVTRSEGNAFFAEELATNPGDEGKPTEDLTSVLERRLDRLSDDAGAVVRAAAVAGRTVRHDLLARVVGLDDDALDRALAEAIEHHVLERVPPGGHALGELGAGTPTWSFRHALLGETLALGILPGAARRLHQAWIEALLADPRSCSDAAVAAHAAAIGDAATAARASVAAGHAAMRVGGARDALGHYEAALGWIDDDVTRAEVALSAAQAAGATGDHVRALGLLREVLESMPAGRHPRQRAALLAELASWHNILDLPGSPLDLSAQAVALLPQTRDALRARVLGVRVHVILGAGKHREEAEALADELAGLADELGAPEVVAEVRMLRARLLEDTDPARQRDTVVAVVAAPETPDEIRLQGLFRLGMSSYNAGEIEAAHDDFVRGADVAERLRRPWGLYGFDCRLHAGRTAYLLGRWEEAADRLSAPADLPYPARGLLDGSLVELAQARRADVDPAPLLRARAWWEVDALLVLCTMGPAVEHYARQAQHETVLEWIESGVALLRRVWSPRFQGWYRLAALLAGRAADLPRDIDPALQTRFTDLVEEYAGYLLGDDATARRTFGPESRAWRDRLVAERHRIAAGAGEGPDPGVFVAAWERSVSSFDALPHVAEAVGSRVGLARALIAVGRRSEAADVVAQARARAEALGARPLLAVLDDLAVAPARGGGGVLTAREREVLELVAQGRTNGQIATSLFISPKTVSVHVSNVLAKLGASTRGESVATARRLGLLG